MLNVGPTAEGVIPQPSVDRLEAMGAWLDANGEAVYGTQPGPIQGEAWVRSTTGPGAVYLHVFEWPAGGHIRVSNVGEVSGAYLLADASRAPLPVAYEGDEIVISGPSEAPDAVDTVVVLSVAE